VVAVEGGASLVVDDTPGVEVWLAGAVASFPRFDTAFDRFDSPTNSLLDEVGGEVSLVSKTVVESVFGF